MIKYLYNYSVVSQSNTYHKSDTFYIFATTISKDQMTDNSATISKAIKQFHEQVIKPNTYRALYSWCETLMNAAIEFRYSAQGAHNFTGNLINSIVVILYEGSKKATFFSSTSVGRSAIRSEMTATTNSKGQPRIYKFKPDWEGKNSSYTPEVTTDESWGKEDAIRFASQYKPKVDTDFSIVVAYTSEYAEWVEFKRHTTGFFNMLEFTETSGVSFVGLKRKNN